MADVLYDTDILAWSRAQADRLRRLRDGERVNDLDWDHVIEEIEDVGKSQLQGVESLLLQAMIHALKIIAWPDHMAARKWRNEVRVFLVGARRRYEPGMRQHLDVADLYADARDTVRSTEMGRPAGTIAEHTDLSADELMDRTFGAEQLVQRLGG